MILVYGDDSADEKCESVCAVTGVVGTIMGWRSIERQWLVREGGIPFHAKDCDSDQGDFKEFTHAENKELYKDMVTLIAESHLHGFGLAIDLMASSSIFPNSGELAYYRAFIEVLKEMKNCAKANQTIAEFTFDMRMDTDHNAGLLYGTAKEHELDWSPYLAEKVTFEFARKNPRVRVADLVAREVMKALDNDIGPVKRPIRKSWKALRDTGRFRADAFGEEWFRDLKKNYPKLEESVGFTHQDYVNWVKARNCQHNITNMFLFVKDIAKRDAEAGIQKL